ncbi:MAG: class I SAM-dependent methyltransferase [Acidimicrobiia bacterium]|nr:class I SAM-dependent methyltransferase [Acidimicrobiia bacterium]
MEPSSTLGPPDPALQERISGIIRRHSSNREDIRRAALDGLELGRVHRVLDLGCGFGFATRALQGRVGLGAGIIGVDCRAEYRTAFLASTEAAGGRGSFLCQTLQSKLDFPTRAFDLVLASYSLYFFPAVIPEVARVLQPGGWFVAVTHSESDFAALLWAVGVPPERSARRALTRSFSAENGAGLLERHFSHVEARPYPNTLEFEIGDLTEFLTLVRYKAPQLVPADGEPPTPPEEIEERARDMLRYMGRVVIEKDDAIFVCTGPRVP